MAEDEYETEDILEDDEDNSYSNDDLGGNGESIAEKPTMDNLFDTERNIKHIEKAYKGETIIDGKWVKTSHELARDKFIGKATNFLRVIINPTNLHTYLSQEEGEKLLLEANTEFISQTLDEPSISDEDLGTVTEQFDFAAQTFAGQMIKGHGSQTLKDIYAGLNSGNTSEKKEKGVMEQITGLFSKGD